MSDERARAEAFVYDMIHTNVQSWGYYENVEKVMRLVESVRQEERERIMNDMTSRQQRGAGIVVERGYIG